MDILFRTYQIYLTQHQGKKAQNNTHGSMEFNTLILAAGERVEGQMSVELLPLVVELEAGGGAGGDASIWRWGAGE